MTQFISISTEQGTVVEVKTTDMTAQNLNAIMEATNADVLIF